MAKGFLGFTAAVLIVSFFTIWLSNAYYAQISRVPDMEGLRENQNLLHEKYEKVSAEKYMGKDGGFAVLSQDGTVFYRSSDVFASAYTADELACISSYDSLTYVEHTSFTSRSGQREHLFFRYIYDSGYDVEEQIMILNDRYEVVGGGFEEGKKMYSDREAALLMGETHPGFELMKCQLDEERVLLTLSRIQDTAYYNHLAERANRIFLVVIPLYIVVLSSFLMWISRKIKNPLVELNRIIERRTGGNNVSAGELEGPWEIRQIGRTFDRMTERLEASERERRRLDQERQKMLAAISHDLKTPITVISGYTKAICDGRVPKEELEKYLNRIDAKSSELNDLINSFHEFSKVEHPDFSLHTEKTEVCEFLRSYLAERYDEIEFHGYILDAMVPDNCRIYSMIDGYHMKRAMDNILYNTLQHNRKGTSLAVGVKMAEHGPDEGPYVQIFMADNGTGVSEELKTSIFEPFVRGSESRTGKGSGLGLSISRNIVRAHGGELQLGDAAPDGYSTAFEILLKMAE